MRIDLAPAATAIGRWDQRLNQRPFRHPSNHSDNADLISPGSQLPRSLPCPKNQLNRMESHTQARIARRFEAIRPTTTELEKVRDRAAFAGRLGQVLWSVGKALIAFAAGAAAAYYSLTGRPPP